ncbi:hypothetical protein EWM64_g10273 [Hericium alpestre]|uniref:N-acetyltransferase domain-containing protein n=1 Tax=Hericium alpestre TaxID=135208 RepID=A0A4Y9ZIS2_9AGAM|nr:hypothetical protein EWM64_g10273 [Hericium alpestre]
MAAAFHIRPATKADVQTLLDLILALAVYEKAAESAQATAELLTRNLFEDSFAHALLAFTGPASEPGAPVGMALYFFNFSTWTGRPGLYLEDLFVKPEHRNLGVGKALFAQLAKIAQEKNCARMDWQVLTWNEPSIRFYEDVLKAKPMGEWQGMRLEEEGIENLKKIASKPN